MSSEFSNFSPLKVRGTVSSTKQGMLIGTVPVEPGKTGGLAASDCEGITVMYDGKFYTSNGTTWTETAISGGGVEYSSLSAEENGEDESLVTTGEKYTWDHKQDALVAGTDYQEPLEAGVDYQEPLVAGTDYQTPLVAGTDYQTPLVAGTDYQTPLEADVDYQTPLVAGTDYQMPLTAGTDYQTPLVAGTDYVVPESGKGLFSGSYTDLTSKPTLGTAAACDTGTSAGNVPVLNSSGKLSNDVIPSLAIGDYIENSAGTYANLVNLSTAEKGDITKVTAETGADVNKNGVYWLNGTYSTASNWVQIVGPSNVISVNGSTGVVTGLATVTGTEALTNKTINGYTPGDAMAKGVDAQGSSTGSVLTSSSTDSNVPTSLAVYNAIDTAVSGVSQVPATTGASSGNVLTYNGSTVVWAAPTGGSGGMEVHTNLTADTWTADMTYTGYGYKSDIAITGVTASDVALVIFGVAEAVSGDYAPISETYAGGVRIYSAVNTSITIPTILITKG